MSTIKNHNAGQRTDAIMTAWDKYAPDAEFAGMTLKQFLAATSGSTDGRKTHGSLKSQVKGQREAVMTSDANTRKLNKRVIAAIVADESFGDESALYAAIGLVPPNQRASGLTRRNGNGHTETPA